MGRSRDARRHAYNKFLKRILPLTAICLLSLTRLYGAENLQLTWEGGALVPSELLEAWLMERGWYEMVLERATTRELRELDAQLLSILPEEDAQRRTWIQRIGHYQRAVYGGARVVWLTRVEQAAELSAAV